MALLPKNRISKTNVSFSSSSAHYPLAAKVLDKFHAITKDTKATPTALPKSEKYQINSGL